MRALLIDDEKMARDTLRSDIEHYCPEIIIVGEADSVKSGISAIRKYEPDIIFLDVEMSDGTGFNILEQLSPKPLKVIFTTAYDKYAVKAFKFSAIDYLLKPVDSDELVAAVKKLDSNIDGKSLQNSLKALIENTKNAKKELQKLVINTTEGHSIFSIGEIIRFESDRNYTIVHSENEKPLLVSKTLKYFEDLLKEQNFERVHQSHIVNVKHIKKYIQRDGGYLIMSDKSNVPVSQRKKTDLLSLLDSL